jgi:hypothetical protein
MTAPADALAERELAAAAPVTALALEALAALAAITADLDSMADVDDALAAPLAAWSRRGDVRAGQPPLRRLAAAVIAAGRAAQLTGDADHAALARAAAKALRDETAARRAALRALGEELDGQVDAGHAAALVIAARAREAVALGDAVIHHLRAALATADRAAGRRVESHLRRWQLLVGEAGDRYARTLAAIDRLTGCEH